MPRDLSPTEVALRLGTSTRSVQRWIAAGRLPAWRIGGRWRVAIDVIDAMEATGLASRATPTEAMAQIPTRALAKGHTPAPAPPAAPIRTLFIANRGEIATRIARTCQRLGIHAVVPATEGPEALDLLDPASVIAAASASGADAVHPGFGFLAENAEFADGVIAAGLRWVGPPPSAIRLMGDKAAARRLAASLGVPVLEGYDAADQSDGALAKAAERIGYPLLVKPAAGGGGKGIRVVRDGDALLAALGAARREAAASFGDDRLILERLVEGARHVEVQVLFDADGRGVQLGERDCSIQRRHQKVLEEAPSPTVDAALRDVLGQAALALGRAVGYTGAGTCEFLLDDHGSFTFLEMNTRLQVEHPVTELVTGRDLVADQLQIAAGERPDFPAPGTQPARGHAIEVRLYAEDADAGFLPAFGRVEALRWPAGDGVRVDPGIEVGSEITGRFDPMLAKLIAWGPDRHSALDRLTRALDETLVLGVITNLRFLRWLVRQPEVVEGEARTDTLDRIWPPDDRPDRSAIPDAAWVQAATVLTATATPPDGADPWAGGWRLNGSPSVRLAADGEERAVEVAQIERSATTSIPGPAVPYRQAAFAIIGGVVHLDISGRSTAFSLAPPLDVDRAADAARTVVHGLGASGPLRVIAPMPGAVVAVHVSVGLAVEIGDPVVTLEAMKMEHAVATPIAGRIADITVVLGDQVTRGQPLAIIEPG